jgi:uncharacterized membrane protein
MKNFIFGIIVGLPILWAFGVHVSDLARIIVVIFVGLALWRPEFRQIDLPESKWLKRSLVFFIVSFLFYVTLLQIWQTELGRQGIDFAIFTQAIDSISRKGAPVTSLVGMEWRNFIWHHFSPILYVPGLLGFVGMPAYVAGSLVHGVAVSLGALAFWLTARKVFNHSSAWSLAALTILLVNPSFRHGVLFAIHDEIFALPFLGFAYYGFLSKRHSLAMFCLLGMMLAKESMFVVAAAFGVMALIESRNDQSIPRTSYLVIVILGVGAFLGYAFLQPAILGKSFEHSDKLATMDELLRGDWLIAKAWYVTFLFLPFLAFPLWQRRSLFLIIPALPLVGLSLVSRFYAMWQPLNYYGVVPTYIMGFACLVGLGRGIRWKLNGSAVALLVALGFCWSGKKPLRTGIDYFREPHVAPAQLVAIPSDAKVIASPPAALMLYRVEMIWRLWTANRYPPEDFDYIVTLRREEAEIGKALMQRSRPCIEADPWVVRCRIDGRY